MTKFLVIDAPLVLHFMLSVSLVFQVIPSGKEIDISTLLCHGDDSSGEVTIPKEHRTLRTLFESLEVGPRKYYG